jgi:hypothetical protein
MVEAQRLFLQPPAAQLPSSITWRPDAASSPGYVQTWAEVQTQIAAAAGPFTVFLDDSYTGNVLVIPGASGVTDCKGVVTFVSSRSGSNQNTLQVLTGATLLDPLAFDHVTLLLDGSSGVGAIDFSYTSNGSDSTLVLNQSSLVLSGTFPAFIIPDGKLLSINAVGEEPGWEASIYCAAVEMFVLGVDSSLSLELAGYWSLSNDFATSVDPGASVDVGYCPGFRSADLAGSAFPPCSGFAGTLRYLGRGNVLVGGDVPASTGQPYSAGLNEIVVVNPQDSNLTVSLPTSMPNGMVVVVKCDAAMTTSNVTIDAPGALIDGAASLVLSEASASRTFMSYGGNWIVAQGFDLPVSSAVVRATALDSNHIHAWELDDVSAGFVDTGSSASKVNLTASGSPVYSSTGIFGNCALFGTAADGSASTSRARVLASAFSDLPLTNVTLECWVQTYRSDFGFVAGSDQVGSGMFQITGGGAVNQLAYVCYTSVDFVADTTLTSIIQPSTTFAWQYLALVYGGGAVKLYVNGEVAFTHSAISGNVLWTNGTTPSFGIGAGQNSAGQFHGLMSKVRLSNIARAQSYLRAVYKKAMIY